MAAVFCDAAQVTFDPCDWRSLRDELLPLLDHVGMQTTFDRAQDSAALWKHRDGGIVRAARMNGVVTLYASGQFLALVRVAGLLNNYLASIGTVAHKVTRLDATMDVDVYAPPLVRRLYNRGRTGRGVQLTRKVIPPGSVECRFSTRSDGQESGTVYFGSKTAPVSLAVYDKQKERHDAGFPDAPPCLRYELRVRNGLPTLRDCSDPESLFWHHMSGVLKRPPGVPPWVPAYEAFRPLRVEIDPDYRLRRRVEFSSDLAAMVKLADSLPGGRAALHREIDWAFPMRSPALLDA